jgi:hypothetical protein
MNYEKEAVQINKGLFTDTDYLRQPEGTYRFALNAVSETGEGDIGDNGTEYGNQVFVNLPEGYDPIGHVYIGDKTNILFLAGNDDSIIGSFNSLGEFNILLQGECLELDTRYPIKALYRTVKGCETVVYFTDGEQPYRSFVVEKPEDYYDVDGTLNCELLNHFSGYTIPDIELLSVNDSGGFLEVGTYQFAVQILDSNYNEVGFSYVSQPVAIYDESIGAGYREIDGAWNGEAETFAFGVPATSKSITLQIDNLDTDFSFIRIVGIHSTEGLGNITNVYFTNEVPIPSSGVLEYTYTGNTDEYTISSIEEVVLPRPRIQTVKHHAQINNRLLIANTSSPNYNFCSFQFFANQITSKYVVKSVESQSQTEPGNPKNPNTWFDTMSFAGDEIYAFGIVYVFENGYESPAFHIPGRSSNNFDTQLFTVGDNVDLFDVRHLDLEEGDQVQHWKFNNTAQADGVMGFWEASDATYPEDLDCEGNPLYGALAGQPIRHHRFPDRKLVPLHEDGNINLLGIEFDNVDYPHPNIIGHYFVSVKRGQNNRTVFDRGIVSFRTSYAESVPWIKDEGGLIGNLPPFLGTGMRDDVVKLTSPKILVDKEFYTDFYLKTEGAYQVDNFSTSDENYGDVNIVSLNLFVGPSDLLNSSSLNRKVKSSLYLDPDSEQTGVTSFPVARVINNSYSNNAYLINLEDDWSSDYNGSVASTPALSIVIKRDRDVNTDLSTLIYHRIHSSVLTNDNVNEVFGGDVFISSINYMDIYSGPEDNTEEEDQVRAYYHSGFWVESEINMYMRHGTLEECGAYYKGGSQADYLISKVADIVDNEYIFKNPLCREYYYYNKDYSKRNHESLYLPLIDNYDCCDQCLNNNKNRIWYSIDADPNLDSDGYKYILANNFKDIHGADKEITDLFQHQDNLYARTERALYMLPAKEQTLQTNEETLYIGTGEFLSLNPRKLIDTNYGYAGGKDEYARQTTEFGTIFIDSNSNKVFNLTEGAREISNNGLRNWFRDNLKLHFLDSFQQLNQGDYPIISTHHSLGVGFYSAYDPLTRRYILHKRDFEINPDVITDLTWVPSTESFNYRRTNLRNFNNTEVFINKSWTISYNLAGQYWVSYHSYLPNIMFNDAEKLYTGINDDQIWRHDNNNFLNFYDNNHPYIVELVFHKNQTATETFDGIEFISRAKEKQGEQWNNREDVSFNKVLAFNDNQITLDHDLTIQNLDDIYETVDGVSLNSLTESTWRINDLVNYRTDHSQSIFSNQWQDIQDKYFIDKVVNPNAVDVNKDVYELDRLRDKYLGLRLTYEPVDNNIKLTTSIIGTLKRFSVR